MLSRLALQSMPLVVSRGVSMSLSHLRSICSLGLSLAVTFCPPHLFSQAESQQASAHAISDANELKSVPGESIVIPGPLRSFLRMAGISQEVTPEDVLPMLARNVALFGFDGGREKEYLILVDRYVHQARDLQRLSSDGQIRIT